MMTAVEPHADLSWLNGVIAGNPALQAMRHRLILWEGRVIVEVVGSHWEAHAWRAATNGRILPSSIDSSGIRRQQVIGTRVQVLVVEFPATYPAALLPDWIGGA